MCCDLREVRIRRETEGLGEYEVGHNIEDGGNAFCLVNSPGLRAEGKQKREEAIDVAVIGQEGREWGSQANARGAAQE